MPRKATNSNSNKKGSGFKKIDDITLKSGATLKRIVYFEQSDSYVFTWDNNEGITLYDMRLVKDKKGNFFVGMPSKQGSDGKWYNLYYVNFDENEQKEIVEAILGADA